MCAMLLYQNKESEPQLSMARSSWNLTANNQHQTGRAEGIPHGLNSKTESLLVILRLNRLAMQSRTGNHLDANTHRTTSSDDTNQ